MYQTYSLQNEICLASPICNTHVCRETELLFKILFLNCSSKVYFIQELREDGWFVPQSLEGYLNVNFYIVFTLMNTQDHLHNFSKIVFMTSSWNTTIIDVLLVKPTLLGFVNRFDVYNSEAGTFLRRWNITKSSPLSHNAVWFQGRLFFFLGHQSSAKPFRTSSLLLRQGIQDFWICHTRYLSSQDVSRVVARSILKSFQYVNSDFKFSFSLLWAPSETKQVDIGKVTQIVIE